MQAGDRAQQLRAVAMAGERYQTALALAEQGGTDNAVRGWLLLRSVGHGWQGYALALATFAVAAATRLNPLWLMAAGALAGVAGL